MRHVVKCLQDEEGSIANLALILSFFIFIMIPALLIVLFLGQMIFYHYELTTVADNAILGAMTNVSKVDYSYDGQNLWYYTANVSNTTSSGASGQLVAESDSPVLLLAQSVITSNLDRMPFATEVSNPAITFQSVSFNQNVTVRGSTTPTTVTNTNYVKGTLNVMFSVQADGLTQALYSLFGGTVHKRAIVWPISVSSEIQEPNLTIF